MPTLFHSLLSGERKRVSIVLFPSTLHAVHRYVQGCSPFLPFCIRDRCSCPRRVCNSNMKGALMSVSDKLLLRKRAIIETVNDELTNIAQVEHSRHRSFGNFVVNLLGGIAAYCYFPKKPSIRVQTVDMSNDRQFTLF